MFQAKLAFERGQIVRGLEPFVAELEKQRRHAGADKRILIAAHEHDLVRGGIGAHAEACLVRDGSEARTERGVLGADAHHVARRACNTGMSKLMFAA